MLGYLIRFRSDRLNLTEGEGSPSLEINGKIGLRMSKVSGNLVSEAVS